MMEPNIYVDKILEDMSLIGNREASQKNTSDEIEERSDFQNTITILNEQFRNIIESGPCDEMQSTRNDYSAKSTPCSVETLACEIEKIINGPNAKKTQEPESAIPADMSALVSEIDAILGSGSADAAASFVTVDLSENMRKLNMSSQTEKLSNSVSLDDFHVRKPGTDLVLEKQDSEKFQDDDEFTYSKITGSSTLQDLNNTILGIINS